MSNLKIYPFGGVGEIGSNMTVFETESNIVIIDYGILFPYDDFFNINYLIVDTSQINREKKITLFVTHGHEDHIGAIPHLINEFPDIEIFAPEFSALLIKAKLERRKKSHKITIYTQDDRFTFDDFSLDPIHVTHSIPQTHGLVFSSNDFATLFISDFKFDLNPSFEAPIDIGKIRRIFKDKPKTLAMIDSTNILNQGKTLSESDLVTDLEKIINRNQRTFITMFSSNVYRVKNILELAKKHKKNIIPIGRSIHHYLNTADEAGLLSLKDYKIREVDALDNPESSDNVFLVTGSQGEHLGAARRIITGEQKYIKLNEEDLFVFSSKPIPGNEKKIYRLFNQLADQGVEIITYRTSQIHASGHPCQQDLKMLLDEIKPDHYVPIHGETYFLREHIEFIKNNFPKVNPIFLKNFTGLDIKGDKIKLFAFDEKPPHLIHGDDHVIEREKISERRKISDNGLVVISLNHKSQNINISTKGLPIFIDGHIPKVKDLVEYCAFTENKNRDYDYTVEQVRIKTRTFLNSVLGYKPITIVQMV